MDNNVIQKKWCEVCGGAGHKPGCKCYGAVAFVVGCCKRCGGEGLVLVESEDKPKLWIPD